jgi:RNA polymerase sigma-70 factor (ECF subfamily)
VQDAFMTVMQDAGRFDPGRGAVTPWLCGIAKNHLRQRLARDRRLEPLANDEEPAAEAEAAKADSLGELIRAEQVESLRRAVLSLPLRYREVVVLCDLQELSYQDAAAALSCAVGTVRSRLHRGRALLADKVAAGAAAARIAEAAPRVVAPPAGLAGRTRTAAEAALQPGGCRS